MYGYEIMLELNFRVMVQSDLDLTKVTSPKRFLISRKKWIRDSATYYPTRSLKTCVTLYVLMHIARNDKTNLDNLVTYKI